MDKERRRTMRKRLWSMVLCLALSVSLLSGCGKKAETGSGGSPADTEEASEAQDAPEEGAATENDGEYDFSQDKTFNMTAGGIQSAEDTVTLAMQSRPIKKQKRSIRLIPHSCFPVAIFLLRSIKIQRTRICIVSLSDSNKRRLIKTRLS